MWNPPRNKVSCNGVVWKTWTSESNWIQILSPAFIAQANCLLHLCLIFLIVCISIAVKTFDVAKMPFYSFNSKEITWVTRKSWQRAGCGIILIQWLRDITKDQFFLSLYVNLSWLQLSSLWQKGCQQLLESAVSLMCRGWGAISLPWSQNTVCPCFALGTYVGWLGPVFFNHCANAVRWNGIAPSHQGAPPTPREAGGGFGLAFKVAEGGTDAGETMYVRTNDH